MSDKAVLYLRSSKDRSDVSIDAQRRALHELAQARNLVVVGEFVDAVESGKDEDRPGWRRMLAAIQTKQPWRFILAYDTSRIARRQYIGVAFERECQKKGIEVIYKSLPDDADPVMATFLKSILQAVDQLHSEMSKAKGLAGMSENVRQGWRAGGRAPRGYKLATHTTGAIRDGAPVTKSKLEIDEAIAGNVRAYLKARAKGLTRGDALKRSRLKCSSSSAHSIDRNALIYAGHTVWNMHAEQGSGEKYRPRSSWTIKRDTHPALITDDEAEAILASVQAAVKGRRQRNSDLLLTGIVVSPEGSPWHSDGENFYRLGKGKRVSAGRLESAVLAVIEGDLSSDESVDRIQASLKALQRDSEVSMDDVKKLEKRIDGLSNQINRTIDLAAQMAEPAPTLRRVEALEQQRCALIDELRDRNFHKNAQATVNAVSDASVRKMLKALFADIAACSTQDDLKAQARQAIADVVEKIELDPVNLTARMHYAVVTGDKVASPTRFELVLPP